jgi:hypothetical protein
VCQGVPPTAMKGKCKPESIQCVCVSGEIVSESMGGDVGGEENLTSVQRLRTETGLTKVEPAKNG